MSEDKGFSDGIKTAVGRSVSELIKAKIEISVPNLLNMMQIIRSQTTDNELKLAIGEAIEAIKKKMLN